jgi:formate dehydrogenase subunit delta
MKTERLVAMANDIAAFFASEPDRDVAARATADHLRRFWDPRMRREIVAHGTTGGAGLDAIARAAIGLLDEKGGLTPDLRKS